MQAKLAVIVLALVILPTAVLSLMASRAMKGWELILQRRLEIAAAGTIESVSEQVRAKLEDELDQVRIAMSSCLGRGGAFGDIAATAARLRGSRAAVKEVFLFMNPWGFLYPDYLSQAGTAARDGVTAREPDTFRAAAVGGETPTAEDRLINTLTRQIASAGAGTVSLWFNVGESSYYFTQIRDRKGLYVGYEVDPDGFSAQLEETIAANSSHGLVLLAEGPGLPARQIGRLMPGDVIVGDSFSIPERQGPEPEDEPMAIGRLARPFDFVKISALVADPNEIRRTTALQTRLYGWGILLLTTGIVVGAWFVLWKAAAEIRRAKSRGDFAVGVSHDLRTPVSSMKMLAESLYLGHVRDPEKQKKFLSTIVRECECLSQLIERVLFLVRFGQNALVYRLGPVDPGDIVMPAVQVFQARFQTIGKAGEGGDANAAARGSSTVGRPGAIDVDIAADLPSVSADKSAMTQVILNLLDNAVKYGGKSREGDRRDGENTIDVRVTLEHDGRWPPWRARREMVRISVTDHGVGIERKELKKVFRKFYRAPGAREDNVSGVGLGLALCKHVVEVHGGRIMADSTFGEGTTFSVLLPGVRTVNG